MDLTVKYTEPIPSKNDQLTEGEVFIAEFLKDKGVKYKTQVKIDKLKGDNKTYRLADFYLPKYKIYIEYYGQWNQHEEANIRYREKKKVYSENGIPCVYIYPENLGIIEYTLDYRIKTELKRRKMHSELFKHRLDRLLAKRGDSIFWLALSALILCIADYKTNPESNVVFVVLFGSIIMYHLYRILTGFNKYFRAV